MKKNIAAPQQVLLPRSGNGAFTLTCQRCGQAEILYSVSRFSEQDYLELFHELMEAQRAARKWKALHASAVQRLNARGDPGQV